MIRKLSIVLLFSLGVVALAVPLPGALDLLVGPAAAQGVSPEVKYKRETSYDFDDDVVEGELQRPDGEYIDSRRAAKHSSLIKIRDNFVPELLKSAENI